MVDEYVDVECDGDKITLTETTPPETKSTKKSLEEKINEIDLQSKERN